MKTIQQVQIDPGKAIYIIDYNEKTKVIKFRNTLEPRQLHEELAVINGNTVHTSLYHFPLLFLNKFINERRN